MRLREMKGESNQASTIHAKLQQHAKKSKNEKRAKNRKRKTHKHNYNIIKFFKFACINYKSFIIGFACSGYLSYPNIYFGFISLIYTNYISYASHLLSHVKEISILSKLHLYHHNSKSFFGYFNQFIFEIVTNLVFPIALKYIFQLTFINEYVVLFANLIYTSVHLINYSYFHVNDVHERHHLQDISSKNKTRNYKITNFGPDYMDVLFGTKYKPDTQIEHYDHAIINILLSFGLVIFLKYIWEKPENQQFMTLIYKITGVTCLVIYVLLYLTLPDSFDEKIVISLSK